MVAPLLLINIMITAAGMATMTFWVNNIPDDVYTNECVRMQNNIRQEYFAADPLTPEIMLIALAKKRARSIAKNGYEKPKHSYGENWFVLSIDCSATTLVWFGTLLTFDFDDPENGNDLASPGTQIIWKSSKYIGCSQNGTVAVCLYDPKGNIKGKYKDNIEKPHRNISFTTKRPLNSYLDSEYKNTSNNKSLKCDSNF